jgi:hypothetical protein
MPGSGNLPGPSLPQTPVFNKSAPEIRKGYVSLYHQVTRFFELLIPGKKKDSFQYAIFEHSAIVCNYFLSYIE